MKWGKLPSSLSKDQSQYPSQQTLPVPHSKGLSQIVSSATTTEKEEIGL